MSQAPSVGDIIQRKTIFVNGKGGVGKTVVSQAIASCLSTKGNRTLWITFEDPMRAPYSLIEVEGDLFHLNCVADSAFEEYVAMRIGVPALAKLFVRNRLMRYLANAGPGIHELVLLGKVWHEGHNYDRVVVDMPSTGFGLAMFGSTRNFAKLFVGGKIREDAMGMLKTFGDPNETGHLIVGIPEEMPLRESIELDEHMLKLLPYNRCAFLANKVFPQVDAKNTPELSQEFEELSTQGILPDKWGSPIARSTKDYIIKRGIVEVLNLRIWKDAQVRYRTLPHISKGMGEAQVSRVLAETMLKEGWF